MTDQELEYQLSVDELDTTWPVGKELVVPKGGIVMVVGAYQGKVMNYILQRYPQVGKVIGFEPQLWAADKARINTANDPRAMVFSYGLCTGIDPWEAPMGEWGTDACSLLTANRESGQGHFQPFAKAMMTHVGRPHPEFQQLLQPHADVCIMNIEGYEWSLLEDMARIPTGDYIMRPQLDWIDQLVVQFHESAPGGLKQQVAVLKALDTYYGEPVRDDYPAWVYWRKQL